MEHFVRVTMEATTKLAESLNESIFPGMEIFETEQDITCIEIPLARELSESEADEYANRLANMLFAEGHEDFDIEITMDEQGGDFEYVDVKGNNVKLPTVAQQMGWKTKPGLIPGTTRILPGSKPLIKTAIDKFIASLGLKFSSGQHAKNPFKVAEETYDGDDFFETYGVMWYNEDEEELSACCHAPFEDEVYGGHGRCSSCHEMAPLATDLDEAEYQGRKVKLGKPMRGDVKKFKVYVKDPKTGNVKKVNFGDPDMKIKKSNPARRRSFRARHNCDNPGPRTKARYWSCRKW